MWIGTASASTQVEGAAPRSDWKGWENERRVPPSSDGNGFAITYGDDLALLAGHGLSTVRLTLEWARLEPEDGRPDDDEFTRYTNVLQAARSAGLAVWVCLHHVSLPGWFSEDERGFLDEKRGRYLWSRHVDVCAEAFGDLVDGWEPMHDPVGYATGAYGLGTLPPGRRDESDRSSVERTATRAAADAARLLEGSAPVMASMRSVPASWDDVAGFDVLGVVHDGDTATLGELLQRFADGPSGRSTVVLWGTAADDEDERGERIDEAVDAIADAAAGGVPVDGLFYWTGIDGYEFHRGFDAHYGLFDRDRTPREAAIAALVADRNR